MMTNTTGTISVATIWNGNQDLELQLEPITINSTNAIWLKYWNVIIFGLKTPLHVYVIGEHTSMKNELYQTNVKVRDLSIEHLDSTICIALSMHVHVVKD